MANEQTSVPLYAASEVLTAANMNISAGTGVPVFATTVTRDAAFGGANEKVLAEGQLCYLSATNVVQYYDGAAWATVGPASAASTGLVPITAETTFSATTGVTVSNVFTSTYTNYFLRVITTINGADDVLLQYTVGGVATATGYNYQQLGADGSSAFAARTTSQTSMIIIRSSAGTFTQVAQTQIYNPQISGITMHQTLALNQVSAITPYNQLFFGNQSASTQFDGFKLLSANNITGTYQLYGYTKTL